MSTCDTNLDCQGISDAAPAATGYCNTMTATSAGLFGTCEKCTADS